jgi:hypothetical protein
VDGPSLGGFANPHDFVAGADLPFPQDAEIEPRPSARRQQRRHPRLIGPDADAIAGNARLRDLEKGAPDLKAIADANLVVGQSFNREVLAKLPLNEVGPLQLLRPVAIRFDLVDKDRSLLAAMAAEIGLTVSVEIKPAYPATALDGIFPDRGAHGASFPHDIARMADINRQQSTHVLLRLE